jgi:hypothetical protein
MVVTPFFMRSVHLQPHNDLCKSNDNAGGQADPEQNPVGSTHIELLTNHVKKNVDKHRLFLS